MPVILISGALAVFAYIGGNYNFSGYLNMPFMPGTGEVFVLCAALIGAGFGFLWFNTYPAEIFMGDTGSLALGAILAVIAINLSISPDHLIAPLKVSKVSSVVKDLDEIIKIVSSGSSKKIFS